MYPGDYMFVDIGSHHSFFMEDSLITNIEFTSHAISKHLPLCSNIFQLLAYSAFSVIGASGGNFPQDTVLHDTNGRIASYIDLLTSEINNSHNPYTQFTSYIIKHILSAMILNIALPYANAEYQGSENRLVKKMIDIALLHYADPNPLTIAANQLSYSPSTLSVIFKQSTGVKYKEYVQKFRLDKAKYLLSSSTASISKISNDVGYADTKFFSKLFKKYEGVTPSEYRENSQKDIPLMSLSDN